MRTLAAVVVLLAMVGCSGDSEEKGPDLLGVRDSIAEAEVGAFCIGICRTVGGGVYSETTGALVEGDSLDFCPGKIRPCPATQR